jgi:hypothetical protein
MNFSNNVNSISYEYRYPYSITQSLSIIQITTYSEVIISGNWEYRRWDIIYTLSGNAGTISITDHVYNSPTYSIDITIDPDNYDEFSFAISANFQIDSLGTF